jgi:hypothetical protein
MPGPNITIEQHDASVDACCLREAKHRGNFARKAQP